MDNGKVLAVLLELVVRAVVDDIGTKARHGELVSLQDANVRRALCVHLLPRKKRTLEKAQSTLAVLRTSSGAS